MLTKIEIATKVIIINKDKKVLILERSLDDDYASWEYDLPWGRLELWENPINWIKRELYEETWISTDYFLPIKTWSFNKKETQIVGITYISFLDIINLDVKLSFEHSSFKWISKEELKENNLDSWLENELLLAFNFFEKNF